MSEFLAPDGQHKAEILRSPGATPRGGGAAYGAMIEVLRGFLNTLAAAKPDSTVVEELTRDLGAWSDRLAPLAVPESEQVFAFRSDLAGRGQTMAPALIVTEGDAQRLSGEVTFGRYYLGGNGAVHGGAVALLFDEVLGRMAGLAGRSRTAYLHVDYRSITPIEVKLDVKAWIVVEEGRKQVLRAELRHGDVLCAEAEGLFVHMRPGQP